MQAACRRRRRTVQRRRVYACSMQPVYSMHVDRRIRVVWRLSITKLWPTAGQTKSKCLRNNTGCKQFLRVLELAHCVSMTQQNTWLSNTGINRVHISCSDKEGRTAESVAGTCMPWGSIASCRLVRCSAVTPGAVSARADCGSLTSPVTSVNERQRWTLNCALTPPTSAPCYRTHMYNHSQVHVVLDQLQLNKTDILYC